MPTVTTTSAAGTRATAPSTSTTRGRTARPRCSAGDTLITANATRSAITPDACTMDLTARIWRDSASECISWPNSLLFKFCSTIFERHIKPFMGVSHYTHSRTHPCCTHVLKLCFVLFLSVLCMTSIARTTTPTATVTKAATMLSVSGMV